MNLNSLIKDKRPPTTRDQSIMQQSTILEIPVDVSKTSKALLTVRKQENSKLAAQRFCFENNLEFNMINPISKRIDLLLKSDDLEDCRMKHIRFDDQQQTKNQNINLKGKQNMGLNPGVLMYERCKRKSELNQKKYKTLQQVIELQKNKQLTFHPEINSLSKIVVDQIQEAEGRHQFYERRKQEKLSKIFSLKKIKQKQEMKECSFKPMTNSQIFNSVKSISNSDYIRKLSKPKKQDLNQTEKSFSFHPRINKISQIIINGVSFEERQQKYQYDKIMRRSISIRQSTQSLRSSRYNNDKLTEKRNIQKLPIGQYLYNQRHTKQMKIDKIKQQLSTSQVKVGMKSEKIYEVNKYKSFIEIFRCLDSNDDSVISVSQMQTKTIPLDILSLISPLLAEMQEMKISLNQQQFVEALDKLYSTLSVGERNHFLKFSRQNLKSKQQTHSFKPIINNKSSIIANKVRQFNAPGVSLYDFCQQRKSLLDKKLQQRRRQKQNSQIKECTFTPLTNL